MLTGYQFAGDRISLRKLHAEGDAFFAQIHRTRGHDEISPRSEIFKHV